MLLYRSCSVCVNADGVCVEERKMERDQRQGEKGRGREGDTERKGEKKRGKKGEEREREVMSCIDFHNHLKSAN